jgi:hypothetical protein
MKSGIAVGYGVAIAMVAACGGDGDAHDEEQASVECRERTPDTCEVADACFVVEAWRFDREQRCYGAEREPAGCDAKSTSCGDIPTYVRSLDGDCWLFSCSAGIPLGWVGDTSCSEVADTCQ